MARGEWMTADQAAARLGVKPQTLYAYVSRGLLQSLPSPGPRRASRYDRAEVERLAARRRAGGRAGGLELLVDTRLTLLEPQGRLYYRGRDVTEYCSNHSYEFAAEWLWSAEQEEEPPTWVAAPEALGAARAATQAMPESASPVDKMRVAVAAMAVTDPMRNDRRTHAVVLCARSMIAALVECLPARSHSERGKALDLRLGSGSVTRSDSIAARLSPRLSGPNPPGEGESIVALLNAALVLLADHELAASTLAARVAASTWADPYLVVSTGLGVLGGPLHGGASEAVRSLIDEVAAGRSAAEAIGERLRTSEHLAGFGHSVYRGPDPRAVALLALLASVWESKEQWRPISEILEVTSKRSLPAPNVDFAIAALCRTSGLQPHAGEAIFAVARCAGWIAHAIEEYPHRLRFRPRAVYVGEGPPRAGRRSRLTTRAGGY